MPTRGGEKGFVSGHHGHEIARKGRSLLPLPFTFWGRSCCGLVKKGGKRKKEKESSPTKGGETYSEERRKGPTKGFKLAIPYVRVDLQNRGEFYNGRFQRDSTFFSEGSKERVSEAVLFLKTKRTPFSPFPQKGGGLARYLIE